MILASATIEEDFGLVVLSLCHQVREFLPGSQVWISGSDRESNDGKAFLAECGSDR